MVTVGSSVPLWVSVPPVSIPVFIGTRSSDPYGHTFYSYFTGTDISTLTPINVTDVDAPLIADQTVERLLPFAEQVALLPFVQTAKLKILNYGLARREHVVLTADDLEYRWWLYTPIAEINKLVIDNQAVEFELVQSQVIVNGEPITAFDPRGRAVFTISARTIEVAYAIDNVSSIVNEALPYFVAAAYLKASSDRESGILDAVRVGAVSFSFKSIKELREKAAQLERVGYQLLRAGGLM